MAIGHGRSREEVLSSTTALLGRTRTQELRIGLKSPIGNLTWTGRTYTPLDIYLSKISLLFGLGRAEEEELTKHNDIRGGRSGRPTEESKRVLGRGRTNLVKRNGTETMSPGTDLSEGCTLYRPMNIVT